MFYLWLEKYLITFVVKPNPIKAYMHTNKDRKQKTKGVSFSLRVMRMFLGPINTRVKRKKEKNKENRKNDGFMLGHISHHIYIYIYINLSVLNFV